MQSKTPAENNVQTVILLSLPNDVHEDLEAFASFSNTQLDDLVVSYIRDGIANDSRILKRIKFVAKANKFFRNKAIHSRTAQEIINEFNLVH